MPEVDIIIGGRVFQVACQEGEEDFLRAAAALLDAEAAPIADQMGRMPESRLLLMAGLMLADRTIGLQEQLAQARTAPAAGDSSPIPPVAAPADPVAIRVEVPVVPPALAGRLAELADQAESIAAILEARAAGTAG